VLGDFSNDTPVFVEHGVGSVVSELTPDSASVSVYELHHQVLDLGSPLIGLPRIVEERGSSFERSDLADGGAADSEPGGPNHNDLTQAGATGTDSFDGAFNFPADGVVDGESGGLVHSDSTQAGDTGSDDGDEFVDSHSFSFDQSNLEHSLVGTTPLGLTGAPADNVRPAKDRIEAKTPIDTPGLEQKVESLITQGEDDLAQLATNILSPKYRASPSNIARGAIDLVRALWGADDNAVAADKEKASSTSSPVVQAGAGAGVEAEAKVGAG